MRATPQVQAARLTVGHVNETAGIVMIFSELTPAAVATGVVASADANYGKCPKRESPENPRTTPTERTI